MISHLLCNRIIDRLGLVKCDLLGKYVVYLCVRKSHANPTNGGSRRQNDDDDGFWTARKTNTTYTHNTTRLGDSSCFPHKSIPLDRHILRIECGWIRRVYLGTCICVSTVNVRWCPQYSSGFMSFGQKKRLVGARFSGKCRLFDISWNVCFTYIELLCRFIRSPISV